MDSSTFATYWGSSCKAGREFHEKYSGVPWKEIVGMRNVIIHEYFDLDYDKIWDAASKHILVLKELIETLLAPPEK